jgi:RNA polymerase sigma factor (sigma-70 family)
MDFIQEGNEALLRCAKGYNLNKGKFTTYLGLCVRVAIIRFIAENMGSLRIYKTEGQRKLYSDLTKYKNEWITGETSLDCICSATGATKQDVLIMFNIDNPGDLDSMVVDSPEDDLIKAENMAILRDKIQSFRMTLTPRQRKVFDETMYYDERSLTDVAADLKISRQAVWKLKEAVFQKAREYFDMDDLKNIPKGDF